MRLSFIYWILTLIIGFAVLVVGAGMIAPQTFHRQAEKHYPYSEKVMWNLISQYQILAHRRPEIIRVEYLGPAENGGGAHWKEYTQRGHTAEYEITELVPNKSVKIRLVRSPFSTEGEWIYETNPDELGCTITIKETLIVESIYVRGLLTLMGGRFSNLKAELKQFSEIAKH